LVSSGDQNNVIEGGRGDGVGGELINWSSCVVNFSLDQVVVVGGLGSGDVAVEGSSAVCLETLSLLEGFGLGSVGEYEVGVNFGQIGVGFLVSVGYFDVNLDHHGLSGG